MGTKKESQGGLVDIEHKVSITDAILKYHMHYSISGKYRICITQNVKQHLTIKPECKIDVNMRCDILKNSYLQHSVTSNQ